MNNDILSHFRMKNVVLSSEDNSFIIGRGIRHSKNGLYLLLQPDLPRDSKHLLGSALAFGTVEGSKSELWYRHLAHLNFKDLCSVHSYADGVRVLNQTKCVCQACQMGKSHKISFHGHLRRAAAIVYIIHSKIVGPVEISFPHHYRYVVTLLDDYSRYSFVGFMKRKSDLSDDCTSFVTDIT